MPKRRQAAAIAQETLAILNRGHYDAPGGRQVDLSTSLEDAINLSVGYPPRAALPPPPPRAAPPRPGGPQVDVTNETTLAAARCLVGEGRAPAALNFASAKRPGGGFLNGALAQEESLARASGLYACIAHSPMYEQHGHSAMYSDWVIYSPDVPVFRDDEGALLDEPWPCSFLTCAAVNARAVLEHEGGRRRDAIAEAMRRRVARVLAVAAAHGHDTLVLGAWGCGVFGNDPSLVAGLFHAALDVDFRGAFDRVTFAVVDGSPEAKTIGPFYERFGAGAAPG